MAPQIGHGGGIVHLVVRADLVPVALMVLSVVGLGELAGRDEIPLLRSR
ncbi:MAG: hypothetical protein PVH41_12645 [Anaerolineae bacterium]